MGLFKRTAACLVGMALLFSTAAAETTLHFTFAGDCTLGSEEAKRKQARKTDGLPADGGSVETPEQAETPKDMFDEVIERRNKRKF